MAPPSREFGASINPGAAHTVIPHNTAPPSQLERTFLDHAHGDTTPSKLRR